MSIPRRLRKAYEFSSIAYRPRSQHLVMTSDAERPPFRVLNLALAMPESVPPHLLCRKELIETGLARPPKQSAKRKRWDEKIGRLMDPEWMTPGPSL